MTRAKDHLHLITPRRFFTQGQPVFGGRHVTAARTWFIPSRLRGAFGPLCGSTGSRLRESEA
jgi:DNA helicase-2/ATP-dependent DNA helicase PcrA